MRFSAIIIARNEEKFISESIASLLNQSIPRSDYEIIAVVDALSLDNTFLRAKEAGADKVIHEKTGGTNPARQRGVAESKGDIVAFLDADCMAPHDWLKKIEKVLMQNGVAGVSGPYGHGFKGITNILDAFYNHALLPALPRILHFVFRRKAGVMIGGNMAMWRSALNTIGGLPPLKFYGDDAATAMLLTRKVGKIIFDQNIVVRTSPRRFAKGLLKPVLRYGRVYLGVYFSKLYR